MASLLPVILAGGSGTRLWPLSRKEYPKQYLSLQGEKTLIQETAARLAGFDDIYSKIVRNTDQESLQLVEPLVVCNEKYRFYTKEQFSDIGFSNIDIILEPFGRNTAPALTMAALMSRTQAEDPILFLMPSDHVITNPLRFKKALAVAAKHAFANKIVTFGIVPRQPETGFGYLEVGDPLDDKRPKHGYILHAFREKPPREVAGQYVAGGKHLWNSGMFMMKASRWIEAIGTYAPDILTACCRAVEGQRRDGQFVRIDELAFEACPDDSIDYAVMEKIVTQEVGQAVVVPLDAGWSDVGSWMAVHEVGTADATGNVTHGDVHTRDTKNSIIMSNNRLVTTIGLEDVVVVETSDAVLVVNRNQTQDVKKVVEWLDNEQRQESQSHRLVYQPWGHYEWLDEGERFQVRRLTIKPGASLSEHVHHHRAEHWVVVKGTARIIREREEFLLTENQSTHIPLGMRHRLENPGSMPLEIIEIHSGSFLSEEDIVRFEAQVKTPESNTLDLRVVPTEVGEVRKLDT